MAPRGGSDGGKDITFYTDSAERGLACVTLQKDIDAKFKEDFSKHTVGEFSRYILFCTAYLTASQKQKFVQYCADNLQAELVIYDMEALRSLLDSALLPIREKYLQIVSDKQETNTKSLSTYKTENVPSASQRYPYDVALSFAGEDRVHAEALAEALRRYGISVFYDKYEKNTLWGKDLYIHLSDLYQNKARYCVMFFSQYYVAKTWTKHELKAAQARALKEQQEYILPICLDSTEIPGILKTTAYLNWHEETPESVAEAILEKLGKVSHVLLINERTIMDWLVDEAQMSNGKVSVDLGDIPGVKHSMRMTKNNEDWETWYGMWFEQEFTERMGFEPTEESVVYALEKYREIAE